MYENTRVAFQGSSGSFSEEALIQFFSDKPARRAHSSFQKVFETVDSGACEYGIVPIENSIIGTISSCIDRFVEHKSIAIVGETTIKIEHALIGLPGTQLAGISTVYSQLPGLEQCSAFLSQQNWHLVPFTDTAAAVRHVASENQKHNAAIASARAGRLYNLTIIQPNIENNTQNFTRFAIIKKSDKPHFPNIGQATNTCEQEAPVYKNINVGFVIFTAPDRPGSLLECLRVFQCNNVNLHKIESRPIPGKPWEYRFLAELDCSSEDNTIGQALQKLNRQATDSHVIGLYNRDTTD